MALLPELRQIFVVARRAMRHVPPLGIFFNRFVVEVRRPPCKFGKRLAVRTAPSLRVRVSRRDTGLNLGFEASPLLIRRFALHPPEHYMTKEQTPGLSRPGRLPDPTVKPPLGDFACPYANAVGDLLPTVTAPHQLEHGADLRVAFKLKLFFNGIE